ncbi:MAG: YheT family hydrolase [Bryobacteraceae bacterium]
MRDFVPLFRNPHLQTLAGHFWPRPESRSYPAAERLYNTAPGVRVMVEEQSPAAPRGDVVLVHGLEGSGESGYMRGAARLALEAGFRAHRFHMRTCGGTERLSQTLYHSGLTSDVAAVVRELGRPVYLAGFSLGGNVALKLAGELGEGARELIRGICAVSTPLDLAACSRRLGRLENRVYEMRFLRKMRSRLLATGRYTRADFHGIRSIIAFDERITAPAFGFRGAQHYYETQSSARFLEGIRVPTLLLQAQDDPLVPFELFRRPVLTENPWLTLHATPHGGHLGFLARGRPRFWAETAVIEWFLRLEGTNRGVPPS